MKVRMAVARCCCPRPGVQPPVVPFVANSSGRFFPASPSANDIGNISEFGDTIFDGNEVSPVNRQSSGVVYIENITIPQAANIVSARMVWFTLQSRARAIGAPPLNGNANHDYNYPLGSPQSGDGTFFARSNIRAWLTPNATPPFNITDLNAQPRTVALVPWNVQATVAGAVITPEFAEGGQQQTPDFTAVVQELVDQAGWLSGNNMQFFFDENGSDKGGTGVLGWGWFSGQRDLSETVNAQPTLEVAWT